MAVEEVGHTARMCRVRDLCADAGVVAAACAVAGVGGVSDCQASTIMEILKVTSALLLVGGLVLALVASAIIMVKGLRELD